MPIAGIVGGRRSIAAATGRMASLGSEVHNWTSPMYSTCLFCHANLGTNGSVEHFPIGRRLVFDTARGRLWVVCRGCERWNLSPIDERWEATEECERAFRATRLRISTDNIGLARLRDGLELVRIGAPLRPEMAAWRYGDQFGTRRKRHLIYTGAGLAAFGGFVILGPMTGIIATGGFGLWSVASAAINTYDTRRVRARIKLPEYREPVVLRRSELWDVHLVRDDKDWALRIPFKRSSSRRDDVELTAVRTGDAALRAAAKLLPAINAAGATRDQVEDAVDMIGEVADPAALFAHQAGIRNTPRGFFPRDSGPDSRPLRALPSRVLLALEMATHEDSERRAMAGELRLLHEEWQRAEEIAAISDDLLVPDQAREQLDTLKARNRD